MTDQTKAPERIWVEDTAQGTERPNGVWDSWSHPSLVEFIRADIAAEQVREAYERGLDDAARVAEVKPRKGGRPLSGPHHAGIRRGRSEAACLIRALKSDDTNEAAASPTKEPSPGRVVSSVAPAALIEKVSRAIWSELGADYPYDEAQRLLDPHTPDGRTHQNTLTWVHDVARAAIGALPTPPQEITDEA